MEKRAFVHGTFILLLPVVVAWYGLSPASAIALVLLALLWRWTITLSGIIAPPKGPELVLRSISASHFVEKVRWCLDRLGVNYTEQPAGGTLGVFFSGRTVPVLRFRTGIVYSSIGNSPEILRYLWGRYSAELPLAAAFLQPNVERLEIERKIDRCGVNLQVWVYFHILNDRRLTLHAWGADNPAIPLYQRWLLRGLFPVQRFMIRKAFRISPDHYRKSVAHIESFLAEVETMLADGRSTLLGGELINFTDIGFAAISGLWLQPAGYGGGKADTVRISREQAPAGMRADIERWTTQFPITTAFIEGLYRDQRIVTTPSG